MKWNHAAGTDCFSAPSLNTILFRSEGRGAPPWWVNRKDSTEHRQHRLTEPPPRPEQGNERARKLFSAPDRCSLFKLIRTCLRNNWKRDFGLDFSCRAELRAVPLSHHRHCLPSLLIITYLLDTLSSASSLFSWKISVIVGARWVEIPAPRAVAATQTTVNEKWRLKSFINLSEEVSVLSCVSGRRWRSLL